MKLKRKIKMYDPEKIKTFHESIVEDYNRSLIIEDIIDVNPTNKTDGTFTQIGIRPVLSDEIFTNVNFDPRLPGAGRIVAIAERDFLINSLIENKDIEKIKFEEDIIEFPKQVFSLKNAIILISTKFYVEIFTKLAHRVDYEERYPRLDRRYKIISIPEKVLKNKIIVIDKNAILWEKKIFRNTNTKKKEKLDITINPREMDKVDITINSLNKIKNIDTELIKILEIEK